jgi:hypothetical protein
MDNIVIRRVLLLEEARTLRVAIVKFRGEPMTVGDADFLSNLSDDDLSVWTEGLRDIARSIGGLRGGK